MFRPDPNGAQSVAEIIDTLTDALADVPPDSPRAHKLAELIRGLRTIEDERPAAGTGVRKH